jgi:DNA-binding Xre family transcriptional regulator
MMKKKTKNPHRGSSFDSFLQDEGMYEEVNAKAVKKVLTWQLEQALAKEKVTKTELAARMHTSRAAVNRLLDPDNPSLNLQTMEKAARALGKKLAIQLAEA